MTITQLVSLRQSIGHLDLLVGHDVFKFNPPWRELISCVFDFICSGWGFPWANFCAYDWDETFPDPPVYLSFLSPKKDVLTSFSFLDDSRKAVSSLELFVFHLIFFMPPYLLKTLRIILAWMEGSPPEGLGLQRNKRQLLWSCVYVFSYLHISLSHLRITMACMIE